MQRKADIRISERFCMELSRLLPGCSDAEIARRMGCERKSVTYWKQGVTPSAAFLARLLSIGGDVEYVLTGFRKPKEPTPDFLAEYEEENS